MKAEQQSVKAQLAAAITKLIEQKGWTQTETAHRLDMSQSKVSALMRGGFVNLSVARLFVIINQLGYDVEIRISANEAPPARAQTRVTIL